MNQELKEETLNLESSSLDGNEEDIPNQPMKDNINNLEKKPKGEFWIKLLESSPILGAIAGLVLLFLGIFRHKDKILPFMSKIFTIEKPKR